MEHLTDTLESAALGQYPGNACGKGTQKDGVKVAVNWMPEGGGTNDNVGVVTDTGTVNARERTDARRWYGGGSSRTDGRVESRAAVTNIAAQHMWNTTERSDGRTSHDDRRAAGDEGAVKAANGRAANGEEWREVRQRRGDVGRKAVGSAAAAADKATHTRGDVAARTRQAPAATLQANDTGTHQGSGVPWAADV